MAMRSPINWAVLGLLIERPGYGYDLFERFGRTYGDALDLSSPSQVYGALKALKQKALIEQLPRDDDGAGDELSQPKPRYRATAAGSCHYREWLIAQACERRQSLELLTLLVAPLPPRDALVVIDRYERHLLSQRTSAPAMSEDSSALARRLAAHAKQLETGLALKWATYARSELEAAIDARRAGPQLTPHPLPLPEPEP
jgi:DNA-binding PadR family transcriptional regulator